MESSIHTSEICTPLRLLVLQVYYVSRIVRILQISIFGSSYLLSTRATTLGYYPVGSHCARSRYAIAVPRLNASFYAFTRMSNASMLVDLHSLGPRNSRKIAQLEHGTLPIQLDRIGSTRFLKKSYKCSLIHPGYK